MPKPIPPPPPQPSAEETVHAVRLVRWLSVLFALVFLGVGSTYGLNASMVQYGRENAASWNLWRAHRLDEAKLRAHPGGRVAWLVGSSILREAFDEKGINRQLAAAESPWRVAKFGQTRGAAGMSAGMLGQLPVRDGDRVIHNVVVENFRSRWLEFSALPAWRVSMMLDAGEMWQISEWSLVDKLEQTVGVPGDFYRFHTEYMNGLVRWFKAPLKYRRPRKRRPSFHLGFKRIEELAVVERIRAKGKLSRYLLSPDDMEFGPEQFNVQGLRRIREFCAARGAELFLADIPPRIEYQRRFITRKVRIVWEDWRKAQAELFHLPQPPGTDYYDMKHANWRGRDTFSDYLVTWMDSPQRGQRTRVNSNPVRRPKRKSARSPAKDVIRQLREGTGP